MITSIKYAYARSIAAFLVLHLSLTGLSIATSANGMTSSIQMTSASPTTCYTLKTPAPTGIYCGTGNTVVGFMNFISIARDVHSPEDCAQLCGYYPGCKGFNLESSRSCQLFLFPPQNLEGFKPSNSSHWKAWDMQCFTNAYCLTQAPPSTTSPCSPARTQAVADGGFEGPSHHWTVDSHNITFTKNATLARFGARYANFTVYAGHAVTLSQQLSGLNVYQTYYASAFVGINFGHTARKCSLYFNLDGQTLFEVDASNLSEPGVEYLTHWDHFYNLFRPPRADPMLAVTLRCHNPNPAYPYVYVNYLVDQISIEPAQRSCSFALLLQSDLKIFQTKYYVYLLSFGTIELTQNKIDASPFYLINGSHVFSPGRFLTLESNHDNATTSFTGQLPFHDLLLPCNTTEGYLKCHLQEMPRATQWYLCRYNLYLMEPGLIPLEKHCNKVEFKIVYLEHE